MSEAWLHWMTQSLDWVEKSGWLGWLVFIAIYTLTCVLFLPGAVVNFLTSRYLLRGWLQRKFADNRRFHALDDGIAREGWRILLLSRISPVVPHSIVSYACGLTKLSLAKFSLAS